jgi:hypothetical protein
LRESVVLSRASWCQLQRASLADAGVVAVAWVVLAVAMDAAKKNPDVAEGVLTELEQ